MNAIILFGVYETLGCTLGFGLGNLGIWVPICEISTTIFGFRKILAGNIGSHHLAARIQLGQRGPLLFPIDDRIPMGYIMG